MRGFLLMSLFMLGSVLTVRATEDTHEFVFTQTTYDVNEGDEFVSVTVVLTSGILDKVIPVIISTEDITGRDDVDQFGCFDYEAAKETVQFPAGSVPGTQRVVAILINDDNCVERPETFRVTATSTDPVVTFPDGSSTVSIQDNDTPIYQFTEPGYIVVENNSPARLAIKLLSDTVLTFPATVTVVDIPGGSATDEVDYIGVSSNVVFPTGSGRGTTKPFYVAIIDDELVEEDETIILQADQLKATVVIIDDDKSS